MQISGPLVVLRQTSGSLVVLKQISGPLLALRRTSGPLVALRPTKTRGSLYHNTFSKQKTNNSQLTKFLMMLFLPSINKSCLWICECHYSAFLKYLRICEVTTQYGSSLCKRRCLFVYGIQRFYLITPRLYTQLWLKVRLSREDNDAVSPTFARLDKVRSGSIEVGGEGVHMTRSQEWRGLGNCVCVRVLRLDYAKLV